MTKFVADAEIIQTSSAAFFRRFLEPFCSLLLVIKLVVENTAKCIHRKIIAFCLSLVIFSDGMLDVFLDTESLMIQFALLVKRLSASTFLLHGLAVEIEGKVEAWLAAIVTLLVQPLLHELPQFECCIRLHVRCLIVGVPCLHEIWFG